MNFLSLADKSLAIGTKSSQAMQLFSSLLVCLVFLQVALGHGSLKAIEVAGKKYLTWQIHSDDYAKPQPVRYGRRILGEGPVKDFTGKGITWVMFWPEKWRREAEMPDRCGDAGNVPAKGIISINTGAKV